MSKRSKLGIILGVVLSVLLVLVLVGLPVFKYIKWHNATVSTTNQIASVVNSHKYDKEINTALEGKDSKGLDTLQKYLEADRKAFLDGKKNIQAGSGFWGIDLLGKKAKSKKYATELQTTLDNLITENKKMSDVIVVLKSMVELENMKDTGDDLPSLQKLFNRFEEITKKITKTSKGTSIANEVAEINKLFSDVATNGKKMLQAIERGDRDTTIKYQHELEQATKKLENSSPDKLVKKVEEIGKKYDQEIDNLNRIIMML